LTVESGTASPRECELNASATAHLGRDRQNTVVLRDRFASRWHAEVFASNGQWFIRDQDTTNGTKVDGRPVQRETLLADGQHIDIGEVRLRFSLDPSKAPTVQLPAPNGQPEEPTPRSTPVANEPSTELLADEMTVLFRFMNESLGESTPHRVVRLALEAVLRQTGADLTGYVGLEDDHPEFRLVLPEQARVDGGLSRSLTQAVQRERRRVWLGESRGQGFDSDSLSHFTDAVCVPLCARQEQDAAGHCEAPLGALHVYAANRTFSPREVRFCQVLAGSLAGTLHVLRARRALEADNTRLRVHVSAPGEAIVGNSPALCQLRDQVQRLAAGSGSVLIVGESGVGKELVALGLHRHSPRSKGPLIPVNCAAITATMAEAELFGHEKGAYTGADSRHAGFFFQADMGTLFLDEIGELSLEIQAKLLRALETKRVRPIKAPEELKCDVRVIAATNRDLEREVREGRFRRDLYFRLTSRIHVPPLREHVEDVPDLVGHFLIHLCGEYRRRVAVSDAALERLKGYSWPGNVRQLRSVLETAVANALDGDVIHAGDLNLTSDLLAPEDRPPSLNLEEMEAWAIRQALAQTAGNVSQAAGVLGVHRDTLANKMKRYRIDRKG
jgi:Nif-specific regulatory protein